MSANLCISIRFLDSTFHGRGDAGMPEWPPSPLRLFQSMIATAVRQDQKMALAALEWLETLPAPIIVAPAGFPGSGHLLSVPNNAMDVVARAWARGNYSDVGDASPATHRTMKLVRPTYLADGDAVHYLWPVEALVGEEGRIHVETLSRLARNVVTFGWGTDLAVGDCRILSEEEAGTLQGERWLPKSPVSSEGLRVPKRGTLRICGGGMKAFSSAWARRDLRRPLP